jgi:chemotaxis protein MotB
MRGNSDRRGKNEILICKEEVVEGGHHGGSWKVAYADFVTAMMAFFLLMWLLNATTEEQRRGLADYFSPNSVLSHNSSGMGQPFGGRTAFSDGAMLSDLGTPQVTVGQQPVVDDVQEDGTDVIAQPRPHRDDSKSEAPDLGGVRHQSRRRELRRRLRPLIRHQLPSSRRAPRIHHANRQSRNCAPNSSERKRTNSNARHSRSAMQSRAIHNWRNWRVSLRSI